MTELEAAGDRQAINATCPFGYTMILMACVFGKLERETTRTRVVAGLKRLIEQGGKFGHLTVGRKAGRHSAATWRWSRNSPNGEDRRL